MRFVRASTSIASENAMLSNIFRISKNTIFDFGFNCCVGYGRALMSAKSAFFALICFSSCYYLTAYLARLSLMARQRAIKPFLITDSKMANFEWFSASEAISFSNSSNISALFRAIYLTDTLSNIVSLKFCLTDWASIHGDKYAFA